MIKTLCKMVRTGANSRLIAAALCVATLTVGGTTWAQTQDEGLVSAASDVYRLAQGRSQLDRNSQRDIVQKLHTVRDLFLKNSGHSPAVDNPLKNEAVVDAASEVLSLAKSRGAFVDNSTREQILARLREVRLILAGPNSDTPAQPTPPTHGKTPRPVPPPRAPRAPVAPGDGQDNSPAPVAPPNAPPTPPHHANPAPNPCGGCSGPHGGDDHDHGHDRNPKVPRYPDQGPGDSGQDNPQRPAPAPIAPPIAPPVAPAPNYPNPPRSAGPLLQGRCMGDDNQSFVWGRYEMGYVRGNSYRDLYQVCRVQAYRSNNYLVTFGVRDIQVINALPPGFHLAECHLDDRPNFAWNVDVIGVLSGPTLRDIDVDCAYAGRSIYPNGSSHIRVLQ
jgi:hypothetical protein